MRIISRRQAHRTCSVAELVRWFDLQSAYQTAFGLYPLLFYKESALFLGFYSGFTRGEYRIALVDFIVALRRTKGRGRRTLRSPPSPSSGLHLIHPGLSAAAGHICCRGFIPRQVAVFRCYRYSPVPNFIQLSVFGLVSFAFQSGCWAMVVRFSLVVGCAVRACGYVGFLLFLS